MDIQKRCQWCGKPFIAHKMTTLYCSTACIDKAYRAKKKQKLKEQVEDEQQVALPIVESIGDKPYLTPMEAAKLLGVGKTTIYRVTQINPKAILRAADARCGARYAVYVVEKPGEFGTRCTDYLPLEQLEQYLLGVFYASEFNRLIGKKSA